MTKKDEEELCYLKQTARKVKGQGQRVEGWRAESLVLTGHANLGTSSASTVQDHLLNTFNQHSHTVKIFLKGYSTVVAQVQNLSLQNLTHSSRLFVAVLNQMYLCKKNKNTQDCVLTLHWEKYYTVICVVLWRLTKQS